MAEVACLNGVFSPMIEDDQVVAENWEAQQRERKSRDNPKITGEL